MLAQLPENAPLCNMSPRGVLARPSPRDIPYIS